jgi:dTDP-4-dehydrorhamnose reductase
MRILIAGGAGQLARAIRETRKGHELLCPEESHFDLGKRDSIRSAVQTLRPEVILNAAAFTQVDRCEVEAELAMRINGEAVAWLAEAANEAGALLVQISTDYVFDGTGTRPYRESDPTNPVSVYGKSKLLGEKNAALAEQHLIVRTAWLYDAWGKNFYLTMRNAATQGRKLRVVDDQRGTPTTCRTLARQIQGAVNEGWRGLVHGTCAGETTWHGFAAEIFRQSGIQADLSPCTSAEYPTPAARPTYSVLDGSHRRELGTDLMPDWREALAEVIAFTNRNKD